MTLQQSTCFLAAIDHGAFSRAAGSLDISQSSFSKQISRLEEAVGTALFARTNRQLRLTEAGRPMAPHARESTAGARQGKDAVQSLCSMGGGVVSFETSGTAHRYFLHDRIVEFLRRHSHTSVRIAELDSATSPPEEPLSGFTSAVAVFLQWLSENLAQPCTTWMNRSDQGMSALREGRVALSVEVEPGKQGDRNTGCPVHHGDQGTATMKGEIDTRRTGWLCGRSVEAAGGWVGNAGHRYPVQSPLIP